MVVGAVIVVAVEGAAVACWSILTCIETLRWSALDLVVGVAGGKLSALSPNGASPSSAVRHAWRCGAKARETGRCQLSFTWPSPAKHRSLKAAAGLGSSSTVGRRRHTRRLSLAGPPNSPGSAPSPPLPSQAVEACWWCRCRRGQSRRRRGVGLVSL